MRLIRCENVGPIHFFHLIRRFKSARTALRNLPKITLNRGRSGPLNVPSEEIRQEFDVCQKNNIHIVALPESGYPDILRALNDAPPLLNMSGDLSLLTRDMFAIVGARSASALGQQTASEFSSALGQAGYVIVSGLAQGVDTAAHKASLKTGTIAVIAQGINRTYPPQNKFKEAIQKEVCSYQKHRLAQMRKAICSAPQST